MVNGGLLVYVEHCGCGGCRRQQQAHDCHGRGWGPPAGNVPASRGKVQGCPSLGVCHQSRCWSSLQKQLHHSLVAAAARYVQRQPANTVGNLRGNSLIRGLIRPSACRQQAAHLRLVSRLGCREERRCHVVLEPAAGLGQGTGGCCCEARTLTQRWRQRRRGGRQPQRAAASRPVSGSASPQAQPLLTSEACELREGGPQCSRCWWALEGRDGTGEILSRTEMTQTKRGPG